MIDQLRFLTGQLSDCFGLLNREFTVGFPLLFKLPSLVEHVDLRCNRDSNCFSQLFALLLSQFLFSLSPSIGKLSSMYNYAWKQGLKTTYYLRSRPATRINQTTTAAPPTDVAAYSDPEAVACSLENPESCEACT